MATTQVIEMTHAELVRFAYDFLGDNENVLDIEATHLIVELCHRIKQTTEFINSNH